MKAKTVFWGIILLISCIAGGWAGRGIYEDQKPVPKRAVSLGDAHKLGWLQGYSAALSNEKNGTSGEVRALTLQATYLRDSFATVNEFRRTVDEEN